VSDKPNIVGPEYLADLLQKTVKTIKTDVTRRPESLPPRLAIPGSARLMWVESDVIDWLNSFRPAAKKKPGRPSQVSQQSRQALDGSSA